MRMRRAAGAAAAVPLALVCVWTAPSAEAASTHTITLSGSLTVSDAPSLASGRTTRTIGFTRVAQMSHDKATDTLTAESCVGGETRGVLTVRITLRSSELAVVSPTLRLFEGSDCLNNDLDGEDQGIQQGFMPGKSLTNWQLAAENGEAGSDDYARVTFSLKHAGGTGIGLGSPAEPSNVVATRDAADPTRVVVEWSDQATDERWYEVSDSTLRQIKKVTPNSTSLTWTGLPAEKQCFQVRAVNLVGPSDWTPVKATSECV
ncbi:fibronectin type III domain-containing protein [Streptomyces sp. NPDC031705]|uniref:fibronectin type III domain-containing protein n=1 Tax=Streptomyces sp. NPDC031705 TaxID=3155729 RepID=UPI0033D3C3A5